MACTPTMAANIPGAPAQGFAGMRRSQSDSQLRYSVRASSGDIRMKNSNALPRSVGIFPFPFNGSILPSSLRSFLDHTIFDATKEDQSTQENKALFTGNPRSSSAGDLNLVMEKMSDDGKVLGFDSDESGPESEEKNEKRANWIMRILELRTHWRNRQKDQGEKKEEMGEEVEEEYGCCEVDYDSDFEDDVQLDKDSFSRFLVRVPLSETKMFAQLSFLCNMAYVIPEIKPGDLWRYYRLRFVTSSLEKKAEAAAITAKLDKDSYSVTLSVPSNGVKSDESEQRQEIRPLLAYGIAASAASYVHSQVKTGVQKPGDVDGKGGPNDPDDLEGLGVYKPERAAYVAASTMTAVVAAEEEAKQAAARDLRSLHSSPCEWFVCDDLSTCTRCFVIQGSDSLASWHANLFFEPTTFEGMDVQVHRGIYEAAKGIYEQFLPEILCHLKRHGEKARFRFTGHSLGGSLSMLVNLMLLMRGVVKASMLLPVVTFGSPFVFCGGSRILDDLGLDESHVSSVMMHRDIVPRAFSCNYPTYVAALLKRLSKSFRAHPCLNNNRLLYTPLGRVFILQPDEKASPPHAWLPQGSALYVLDKARGGGSHVALMSALRAFLNNPHPLETLSDPTAYGSEGTILRDHESNNYLKAVNTVLRQQTKTLRRLWREQRRQEWWPSLTPSPHVWSPDNGMEKSGLVELAPVSKAVDARV